jgi:hypothetical protein
MDSNLVGDLKAEFKIEASNVHFIQVKPNDKANKEDINELCGQFTKDEQTAVNKVQVNSQRLKVKDLALKEKGKIVP